MSTESPVLIVKESRCYGAGAECSVPFFHSFCFSLSCFNSHRPHSFCATSIKLLCIISLFQLLACAVNSACLALMNSGIAMKFLVAAVSCMIDHEDKTLIDPDSKQLKVRCSFSQCHCIGGTLLVCSIIIFPLELCDLATHFDFIFRRARFETPLCDLLFQPLSYFFSFHICTLKWVMAFSFNVLSNSSSLFCLSCDRTHPW